MGRSGTTKRPPGTAANQHNPRHENGVVGPGKRIQKQRSNGQLNGGPKSSDKHPTTPPLPASYSTTNGQTPGFVDYPYDHTMPAGALNRTSIGAYDESSSSESFHLSSSGMATQGGHRRIDVNATKNPAVHRDSGPMNLAFTVLRSCPLYDTIAILIVLMQIPPTVLTMVNVLFALLTFVPASTSTLSSFTITDIFETTLGTPSLWTIVALDLFVLLIWLFLWGPAQDLVIDLAQSVIALTLGGGTSTRDGGSDNILMCLGIIGVSHVAHNRVFKHSPLRALFLSPGAEGETHFQSSGRQADKGIHKWIKSVVGIHILTQGIVRLTRDAIVRRKRDDMASGMGDPEAAKGSISHADNATHESVPNTPSTMTPETDARGSLPTSNPVDRAINPRRKRRAHAAVRLRQPLWAALASTKIVMAKEYETSRAAAESAGTNATDINNLGNAPFNTQPDRIWITHVGFSEIYFHTSYFPGHSSADAVRSDHAGDEIPGIDRSKPFYVRLNRTIWQPTRISPMKDRATESGELCWSGEIFGLAPMSIYECEFISTTDDSVLFSTNIKTMQAPTADTASIPTPSPSIQRSARPDSPTTTLRTSIATAEAKLAEERNRQKRDRKELKSKLNSARRDIERLASSISSSGGNDDRLRQKVQQSNLHAKQAEEAVICLTQQLDVLEHQPRDDYDEWKRAKSAWAAQKEAFGALRDEIHEEKLAADREIQALNADVAALQQKGERMQARIAKLDGEYGRITDANARGLDEAQRKAAERAAKAADREAMIRNYTEQVTAIERENVRLQQTITNLCNAITAIQHAEQIASQEAQAQQSPTSSSQNLILNPYDIAESNAMNPQYPWNPPASSMGMPFAVPAGNPLTPPPGYRNRGRSSSMLSNVSGFTQSSLEEQPLMPQDARAIVERERGRQKSNGSGSTSGSGSAGAGGSGNIHSHVTGNSQGSVR
jgi:hypothetical protein